MDSTKHHRRTTPGVTTPDNLDVLSQMESAMLGVFASNSRGLLFAHGGSEQQRAQLAEEFANRARAAGALVLAGHASTKGAEEPYGLLASAFSELAPTFAREHKTFTTDVRHRVRRAVLSLGGLLVSICPTIEPLVDATPPVEPLPPWFARERAETLFVRLFQALGQPERPLVMVLESAERFDLASLRVLARVFATRGLSHVVVVLLAETQLGTDAAERLFAVARAHEEALQQFDLGAPESGEGLVRSSHNARDPYALVDAASRAMALGAFDVADELLDKANLCRDREAVPDAALGLQITAAKAECAAAAGDFERALPLTNALVKQAPFERDRQAAERLLVGLLVSRGEYREAIERAACALAPMGVFIENNPSQTRLDAAFSATWEALGERAIEEVADLERMTAEGPLAATALLVALLPAAEALSRGSGDLVACEIVRLALLHGNAEASVVGHAAFAAALVGRYADHRGGYRFGKVAVDLCDENACAFYRGIVGSYFASHISIWTHHLRASIGYAARAHEAALVSGNTSASRRSGAMVALAMLLKGDSLDEVAQEAWFYLGSIASANDAEGSLVLYEAIRRFIDQTRTGVRTNLVEGSSDREPAACRLLHLVEHVLAGSHMLALHEDNGLASGSDTFASSILRAERQYYAALALALTPKVTDGQAKALLLEKIDAHAEDLERFADRCPENYQHKYALVRAERCRLAGDDLQAMRLYEDAIVSARDNGFLLNQALGAECALRFYEARGLSTIAATYLQLARSVYARWGSGVKVMELERRYAKLDTEIEPRQTGMPMSLRKPVDIDVLSAVRSTQAVSEEIVLRRLVVTLMRIVIEHGGAQRCHVLLQHEGELCPVGRALLGSQGLEIEVPGARSPELSAILPLSIVGYVERTREMILLHDATSEPQFSADPYIARVRPRSVMCLPIVRQNELLGIFYLENNRAPSAFTPGRVSLLEFLAVQAAISLEHTTLYSDLSRQTTEHRRTEQALRRSEERLRRLVDIAGVIPWEVEAETELFTYVGPQAEPRLGWPTSLWYKPNFLRDHVHPADRDVTLASFGRLCAGGTQCDADFRLMTQDGRALWLHMVVSVAEREGGQRVLSGFFFDVTERKEAEGQLREQIEIIERQREDIRVLSTPLLDVWDGVVAMPILGMFDKERAALAMEVLLASVSQRGIRYAILDLTGVTTVDAPTAEHLLRLVRAVELLGARAIVAGIRSDVARTIVAHGIGLDRVETKATLKDALRVAGARSMGKGGAVLGRMVG